MCNRLHDVTSKKRIAQVRHPLSPRTILRAAPSHAGESLKEEGYEESSRSAPACRCAGGSLSAQKLELYYYKQEIQAGLKSLTDAFTAENPGITISLLIVPNDADATMSARAAAGTLPEILQMQSYSRVFEYAAEGLRRGSVQGSRSWPR